MATKAEQIERMAQILGTVRSNFKMLNEDRMDVEELEARLKVASFEMVEIGVWEKDMVVSTFIPDYIESQVAKYKQGETYLLSYYSSGSLLQQFEMAYDYLTE